MRLQKFFYISIFILAIVARLLLFKGIGKDLDTYGDAVFSLIRGFNPYSKTISTFGDVDTLASHGFSYLPGFLYLFLPLYLIHLAEILPFEILYKIPILLADIGIGIILIKELGKKDFVATLFALVFWFFNPYLVLKQNFIYLDPVPVFFMLLGLYYLGKSDAKAGVFYAISIVFKTFPIILLPLFILKSKNKTKFLTICGAVFLVVSIPFLYDPLTYIKGALLVHSERSLQGKPFLFNISYNYSIEFFRIIPFKFYVYASILGSWFSVLFKRFNNFDNKYFLSVLAFTVFYIFTPVLNKTYLLWIMPVLALGAANYFINVKQWKVGYYLTLILFYAFYYWYLSGWNYGLHVDYKYY